MRLWTLHPQYLDTPGLLALWREALLARTVIQGKTSGYKNHPQLIRFRQSSDPLDYLEFYLATILEDSLIRGFDFNSSKLKLPSKTFSHSKLSRLPVTRDQVNYEWQHLLEKLKLRQPSQFKKLKTLENDQIQINPLFKIIPGPVESWEKIY